MPGHRFALLLTLTLTACAGVSPPPVHQATTPALTSCLDLYRTLDEVISDHGIAPSSPAPIAGFPYLRVNRFLASYRQESLSPMQLRNWLERMAELDFQARRLEIATLPTAQRAELGEQHDGAAGLSAALSKCSQNLQSADLKDSSRLAALRQRAVVRPDYQIAKRILGLYPLTSVPVRYGVQRLYSKTWDLFAQPLDTLPVRGSLQRFRPPATGSATAALRRDHLGIPRLPARDLENLFDLHAPIWEIDIGGNFDLPGTPRWVGENAPTVDHSKPVVYRYHSFTRWQGKVLLQLNYVVWFAERPRKGPLDILGGALDGLIWRVTLDPEGKPLLYDTIHACGCYHQFFPTSTLRLRREALALPEPPLVPQVAPALAKGERIVVRLSSGEHYVQRVYPAKPSGRVYGWRAYRQLYAIPTEGERPRSLFGPDGIVPGSERGERFLLWPMGIASPGAMRERGRHATAFVGRRHFDDPYLLDDAFAPRSAPR